MALRGSEEASVGPSDATPIPRILATAGHRPSEHPCLREYLRACGCPAVMEQVAGVPTFWTSLIFLTPSAKRQPSTFFFKVETDRFLNTIYLQYIRKLGGKGDRDHSPASTRLHI